MQFRNTGKSRFGVRRVCGLILVLSVALPGRFSLAADPAPSAEAFEALKKAQQEMMQQIRAQQEKIDELEHQARAQKLAAIPLPGSAIVEIDAKTAPPAETNYMPWSDVTVASQTKIKLYGFARLDAIYDTDRPNNTQTAAYIRSEDPNAPGTIGAPKHAHDFTMDPRLTRLGADLIAPPMCSLGGPELTGKIEIDFYNNGLLGQSESREAVRMRHAYLKLKWDDFSLLAGQTWDVISPLYPIVNPDLVMWGAGNLGDRRPQLRSEWTPEVGPGKVILQGEVGLTGADNNQSLDPAGTTGAGFRDGEKSGKPTLQARGAYRTPFVWEKQFLEFGLYVHRAWQQTDTKFNGVNKFDSLAYGLDLSMPLYTDTIWLKGELWSGKDVDDVRGGIFQGINETTGKGIRSKGGFVEIGAKLPWWKWYNIHAGYSTDDPNNADLNTGGRAANRTWYIANRFYFDPVEIGFDYLRWRTDYIGFLKGQDNRFQMYMSYKF